MINFIKKNLFDCRNVKYVNFGGKIKICWENREIDFLGGSYIRYSEIYELQVMQYQCQLFLSRK